MKVFYNPDTDAVFVEEIADVRTDRTLKLQKPGLCISYSRADKTARVVMLRMAAERLGADFATLENEERIRRLADYLEQLAGNLSKKNAQPLEWAARSLRPKTDCQFGTLEHAIEELVQRAMIYGDRTPADVARELASWQAVQKQAPVPTELDSYHDVDDDEPFEADFNYLNNLIDA